MKKKIFIVALLIFFFQQKSFGYSSDPKQFIAEIVDEAKKVLVETNSKDFKTKKLSEMALKTVDIKLVARNTTFKEKIYMYCCHLQNKKTLFHKKVFLIQIIDD